MARRAYLKGPARLLLAPAVLCLVAVSVLPLLATVDFSLIDYRLLVPVGNRTVGVFNYAHLLGDPAFFTALRNTLALMMIVLAISIGLGLVLAVLLDQAAAGRAVLRLLVISPFFVMPPVAALIWKNLLMQPVSGLFAWLALQVGAAPVDWFASAPLASIGLIVAWQWLPFACLILLTSLQSLDREQLEAAQMDGARWLSVFRYITLPHLARPIAIVLMMETIFLLGVFAEIFVTTGGGAQSNNLAFLIYSKVMLQYDVGAASAAGVIALVLANLLAFLLVRAVGRSLDA